MMGAKSDYYTDHIISVFEGFQDISQGEVFFSDAGLHSVTSTSTKGFRAALDVASKADKVLIVVGIDRTVEAETRDRTSTDLPGAQTALIQRIIAAKGDVNVAVCLINGGSVLWMHGLVMFLLSSKHLNQACMEVRLLPRSC